MPMRRGEIYFVDFDPVVGRAQYGMRPALVVSIDRLHRSPLVVAFVSAPNAAPREWPSPLPTVAPQPPVPFPPGVPPPPPDVLVEFDERLDILRGNPGLAPGQQHWLAVNLVGGQPSVVRAAVKVLPRPN